MCGEGRARIGIFDKENDMATKKAAGGGGGGSKKTLSKSGLIQAITEAAGEELSRKR